MILTAVVLLGFTLNLTVSRRVQMENLRITVLNLPADLEGFSILHLSDLHGEEYGERQKAVASALGETRYSCVVMTGDMLGGDGDIQPLLDLLELMPRETPKFYIPGDRDGPFTDAGAHGSLSVYRPWAETLAAEGVTLLDRPVLLTRDKGRIWFVPEELYALDAMGMTALYHRQSEELHARASDLSPDDAAKLRFLDYELERLTALEEMKKEFLATDIQVALTHTPLTEEYVADLVRWAPKEEIFSLRYAGLILAGHYGGGQWRLPWGGAVYVPELGWFPQDELVQGLDWPGGIPQYISPGLGADSGTPWMRGRLFNAPVITKVTLTAH